MWKCISFFTLITTEVAVCIYDAHNGARLRVPGIYRYFFLLIIDVKRLSSPRPLLMRSALLSTYLSLVKLFKKVGIVFAQQPRPLGRTV